MVDLGHVGGVTGPGGIQPPRPQAPGTPQPSDTNFQDILANSIQEIEQLQTQADKEIAGLVSGQVTNVSQAMIAIEQADMAFRTMMEIRNKLLAAYEEINRMNI